MDENELVAHVVNMGSTHLPLLCLFMAQQTSPTQRDWIVNSGTHQQTGTVTGRAGRASQSCTELYSSQQQFHFTDASTHMCHKWNQFDLYHTLWPPHLISLGNGKTISALEVGDTLNQVSMPLIAGNCMLCETFTKNKQSVRKLKMLECRAPGDIPNIKCPGDDSRTLSKRPAMASTNSPSQTVHPQLNKPELNSFDGESRRLTIASTYSLSHLTVNGIHPNTEETEWLACGIGPQPIQTYSDSPRGLRVPMSTVEDANGPTTWVPAWKCQKDTVKGSVNTSDQSDQRRSHYQSNSTPKFKFRGERIKMDVRSNKKWANGDRLTYQRVLSQPLNVLTWNMPTTGKMVS